MSFASSVQTNFVVGLCVILVLFSVACAHTPVKAAIDTTRVFDADFEHTWGAVVETAAQLVVPVESIAKDSGLLTLRRATVPPEWMDCYEAPGDRAANYPQAGQLNIFVKRISDRQTRVTVNSFFQRSHVPPEEAACYSTGQVEGLFFAGITQNLRAQ